MSDVVQNLKLKSEFQGSSRAASVHYQCTIKHPISAFNFKNSSTSTASAVFMHNPGAGLCVQFLLKLRVKLRLRVKVKLRVSHLCKSHVPLIFKFNIECYFEFAVCPSIK